MTIQQRTFSFDYLQNKNSMIISCNTRCLCSNYSYRIMWS